MLVEKSGETGRERLGNLPLRDCTEESVDSAVGGDERACSLRPDARYPGNAVGRIATKDGKVDVAVCRDPKALDHGLVVEQRPLIHAAIHGEEYLNTGADHLNEIAVAGNDNGRTASARSEGRDDVIGFETWCTWPSQAHRDHDFANSFRLLGQRIRCSLSERGTGRGFGSQSMGLVGGEEVDTPCRPPVIVPAAHDRGRPVLHDEASEGRQEPADRIMGSAVRSSHRFGEGVEGPVVERC